MMKHSMILIAVLAAAALVTMVATRQLAVKQQTATQAERTETAQSVGIQTEVAIVKEGNTASLEIAMLPRQTDVSVSTFALELLITDENGDGIETAGTIKPDQTLVAESWSFPILSENSQKEGLIVKLSGVHIATSPYQLAARQVIARIPIDPAVEPDDLIVTLNPEHTKFLRKDTTPIPVDESVVVQ